MSGYTESIFSQSMAGFFDSSKSAVLDYKSRRELVSKARVLAQKVPLARGIVDILTSGVIGSGLHLDGEKNDILEKLSSVHALDYTGELDFYQMQQTIFNTVVLSGECFLIRMRPEEGQPPISSWFIAEPDHVFNPPFLTLGADGNFYNKTHLVIDGIEYDAKGRPYCVWYCESPYFVDVNNKKAWERIYIYDKTGSPNILHIKLSDRPEYPRGLPVLTPLIETLYSLYAYQQAQIQMGIIQSCQALVVQTNTNKTLNPFAALNDADLDSPLVSDAGKDKEKKEFCITPPNNRSLDGLLNNFNYITAGQTVHLAPDESLTCVTPTGPTNSLSEYYQLVLEQCGTALGIPFQILSNKYDTSFSASKASIAQWSYTTARYKKAIIESLLKPVLRVLLEELENEDARYISINSVWKSFDPPLIVDETRSMTFYGAALDRGLISADEAAQKLFGHKADGVAISVPFTTKQAPTPGAGEVAQEVTDTNE